MWGPVLQLFALEMRRQNARERRKVEITQQELQPMCGVHGRWQHIKI